MKITKLNDDELEIEQDPEKEILNKEFIEAQIVHFEDEVKHWKDLRKQLD